MLRLENIKIHEDLSEEEVVKEACRKYKLDYREVEKYTIFKKSIDARNKDDIFYNYTIDVKYTGKKEYGNIKVVNKAIIIKLIINILNINHALRKIPNIRMCGKKKKKSVQTRENTVDFCRKVWYSYKVIRRGESSAGWPT